MSNSYNSSFQSLKNLPIKATASTGNLGYADSRGSGMSHQDIGISPSASWHGGVNIALSQPALNTQPPRVEPRRKRNRDAGVSYPPGIHAHKDEINDIANAYPSPSLSHTGFLSVSSNGNNGSSQVNNMPSSYSMQEVENAHQGNNHRSAFSKENSFQYWSRPTPYKPNNYENIDAFESAKNNYEASLGYSSPLLHHGNYDLGGDQSSCAPEFSTVHKPEIEHQKMLSEDSGVGLSISSAPPPLPPAREDSRGRFPLRTSQNNERIPLWPVNYDDDKSRSGPRPSWASYQPRLNTHKEEKNDNKYVYHPGQLSSEVDVHSGDKAGRLQSDVGLANMHHPQSSYRGAYGYEPVANYEVSTGERVLSPSDSSPVNDLFKYAGHKRESSGGSYVLGLDSNNQSQSSPPPPLPKTAPPMPNTAPFQTPMAPSQQTAPPLPLSPRLPPTPPPKSWTGRTGTGHTFIVRPKPFYNTGTQTEIAPGKVPGQSYPSLNSSTMEQASHRNVEIQVNMDLVTVTPSVTPMCTLERRKLAKTNQSCQVQPSMLTDKLTAATHTHDNYTDPSSFQQSAHRPSAIIDKMNQEKRIPETIREENSKKYDTSENWDSGPSKDLRDSILQSIHDHSPSQTTMLRKLSREFFGNQMKSGLSQSSLINQPTRQYSMMSNDLTDAQRRRSLDPPLLRHSKDYWSQNDGEVILNSTSVKPPISQNSNEPSPSTPNQPQSQEGKKKMDRSKKLSLRKAFGIFDEIENVDGVGRRTLTNQSKSLSSNVGPSRKNYQDPSEVIEEKPLRWYNRPKGDEVIKDSPTKYESSVFSHKDSPVIGKSGTNRFPETPRKLQRTTSEQIRPMKERNMDHHGVMEDMKSHEVEMRDHKHKLSDPMQRHKKSDSAGFISHRSSDPSMEEYRKAFKHRLSDPSEKDNRLSVDSDVFRGQYDSSLQRLSGTVRSTSTSSLDGGHRTSDPDLKKMQHMAVLNFFEMKTGKRLSSSSVDSSSLSSATQKDKYSSLSSRGSSSIDFAVGLHEDSHSHLKLSDDQEEIDRDTIHGFQSVSKSKSLPRDMSQQLGQEGLDVPPTVSRPNSASASSRERKASGSRLVHHKKEKSAPSLMESYHMTPLDQKEPEQISGCTDQGMHGLITDGRPDSHHSPIGSTSPERPDTSPDSNLTLPKQTYDYSSSSSGGNSPTKSPLSETTPKYGYQITQNIAYSEEEESPPPTLPPRNYSNTDRPSEYRFRPPPPPVNSYQNNELSTNFENTPNSYANQLRQQMLKFSGVRVQPKPHSDIKVVMSRPVDRPPVMKDAVMPSSPRADIISHDDSVDSVGLHKIDVKHLKTAENRSLQQQQPPPPPKQQSQSMHAQYQHDQSTHHFVQQTSTGGSPDEEDDEGDSTPPPLPTALPPDSPETTLFEDILPETTSQSQKRANSPRLEELTPNRYSSDSYMNKRASTRQGFNGNYRRNNSADIPKTTPPALATSTSQTAIEPRVAQPLRNDTLLPSASASPPKASETLVKLPSVVSDDSKPSPENKSLLEQGPLVMIPVAQVPPPVPPKTFSSSCDSLADIASTKDSHEKSVSLQHVRNSPTSLKVTNLDEASEQWRRSSLSPPEPVSSRATKITSKSTSFTITMTKRSTEALNGLASGNSSACSPETSLPISKKDLVEKSPHASPLTSSLFSPSAAHAAPPSDSLISEKANCSLTSSPSISSLTTPIGSPFYQPSNSDECGTASSNKEDNNKEEKEKSEATWKEAPATKSPSSLSPVHVRQKSMEEIACEKAAAVVAIQIVEQDKELSGVILPPPEHKMTSDFMSGLFDTNVEPLSVSSTFVVSPRSRDENKENRRSSATLCSSTENLQPYWSSANLASLQSKIRDKGIKKEEVLRQMGVADTSLQRHKEELEQRIVQKLDILRSEKSIMAEEQLDIEHLGKQVSSVVEKKVQNKGELNKYKLYIDDLERVMYLLLKLSGRLAKAENAIMSLPPDADDMDKKTLVTKRNEASEKHSDAKLLKRGIDRRCQQVSSFLQKYLTTEEYKHFEYYVKMKAKLTMDQQEMEDKIKLGEEQLGALRNNMAAAGSSKTF